MHESISIGAGAGAANPSLLPFNPIGAGAAGPAHPPLLALNPIDAGAGAAGPAHLHLLPLLAAHQLLQQAADLHPLLLHPSPPYTQPTLTSILVSILTILPKMPVRFQPPSAVFL